MNTFCNECGNDISIVSHKSWCSDYKDRKHAAPTSAELNALPENIRWYVMELQTMADPSGMIRRNMQLEHDNEALQVVIQELKAIAP